MIGGLIVAVVGAFTKAAVDDGTVIRFLGGVPCSSPCGTYGDLVSDLGAAKEKADTAFVELGERVTTLETRPRFPDDWAEYTADYIWKREGGRPRPSPVRMISTDEGFCFLTRVEGTFEGDREWAEIASRNGWWVLNGGPGRPLTAHARCWRFPKRPL